MNENELILIPNGNNANEIETSIDMFNKPLADLLRYNGLPTENILMPIEERRKVIVSLENVLEILPLAKREKAYYLSKFTVSIISGLFDGALNFLWDETVQSLRQLVVSYDLQYFYTVAEQISNRYKNLNSTDDLPLISEFDLLEILRRIGLLSDVNFKSLEHINYMRNHASAAHPNDNELTGFKMVSFLEDCIKCAINASPDHSVIQIKTLFNNIRTLEIPIEDICVIQKDLAKQPQERLDDFLLSLFGIYCDLRQDEYVYKNVENLAPFLWNVSIDDTKYKIGSKFGLFRKNGDVNKKEQCQRFLEIVNGLKYKDEDSLTSELIEKLQDLRSAHFGMNNFYNEYSHAKSISESLPRSGIPTSVRKQFVKVICQCYIGNGLGYREGVDEGALGFYKDFIGKFGFEEVKEFILLFQDSEFVIDFDKSKADKRLRQLCGILKSKTSNIHISKMLDRIIEFPSQKVDKVYLDSKYKEFLTNIK